MASNPRSRPQASAKALKSSGSLITLRGASFIKGRQAASTLPHTLPFSQGVLAQTSHPLILIQDGARYHTSTETTAFFTQQTARLQVFQLPTYSPDSNPIEKLWKKIKQQDTHLHYFPTFEALTEKVGQALLKFAHIPEEILGSLQPAELH